MSTDAHVARVMFTHYDGTTAEHWRHYSVEAAQADAATFTDREAWVETRSVGEWRRASVADVPGMVATADQVRELANAIALQAESIAVGATPAPVWHAMCKVIMSNVETLDAWTVTR